MSNRSRIVDTFIEAVEERPNDFTINKYYIVDNVSRMKFWIAGSPSVVEPFNMDLGWIQGRRFMRYVNRFKAWKATQLLKDKSK